MNRRSRVACFSIALALFACNGTSPSMPADASADAPATIDATSAGDTTTDALPGTTDIAPSDSGAVSHTSTATTSMLSLDYDVDIQGAIAGMNMNVSVTDDVGTIEIDGLSYPVIAYEQIPWTGFSLVLYQALAVLPDRWAVMWFYCNAGTLETVDYEDTLGAALATYNATGTCMATSTAVNAPVQVPTSTVMMNSLVQGFTVTGTQLAYDGTAPGSMTLDGDAWTVYPFDLINCSTTCGSPGWYELHSLFWKSDNSETCFGIYYLETNSTSAVPLSYSICLPQLGSAPPDATSFPSRWMAQ